jgi:hypothetical protein
LSIPVPPVTKLLTPFELRRDTPSILVPPVTKLLTPFSRVLIEIG